MNEYLKQVNSLPFYLITGGVLLFILIMCVVFLVKSYRAGIAIGMDKKVMRRAIMSSATFSVLPGVSILLGVIALSGSLGVPLSWLRLSVVGALQYELNVAEIAATGMGLSGLKVSEMSIGAFTTIALVMTAGILSGITCCIFGLKKYLGKVQKKEKQWMRLLVIGAVVLALLVCFLFWYGRGQKENELDLHSIQGEESTLLEEPDFNLNWE